MSNVLAIIIATIITVPLIGWYFIYITTVKITKKKSYSIRLASDVSAFIFMAAVYFIMLEIWDKSFLWLILIVFFLIAILFTLIHWKKFGDIQVGRLFRGIWRFNFIIFFFSYIGLSIYGLVFNILNSI